MKIPTLLKMRFFVALPIGIAFIIAIGNVDAAPYQELEPRKGYVPVYIRYGNTPLSEIHPKLAEAFHEDGADATSNIESASLIEMKDGTDTKDTHPSNAESPKSPQIEQTATSIRKESDSDIASFDVIKGTDPDIKKE